LDELNPHTILAGLATESLGRQIVYYPVVGSTNLAAKQLAAEGAADGTLVIADEQTAGRGRLDRRWFAPPGSSLLFSLIFRPALTAGRVHGLTMVCGLGIREAVREVTALPAQLKWPNDIMVHGRKAGGILTEASSSGEVLNHVVVGVGLNVNLPSDALPPEFGATSLRHELGRAVPRPDLLQKALLHIERRYKALQTGWWPVQEWARALETLGRVVRVQTEGGIQHGRAETVDEDGALILRGDDGKSLRVILGDILSP